MMRKYVFHIEATEDGGFAALSKEQPFFYIIRGTVEEAIQVAADSFKEDWRFEACKALESEK